MKKVFLSIIAFSFIAVNLFAQKENNATSGFKKENVFIGGSLNVGFATGALNLGGSPEIGYSLNQYLDAGLVFNINYSSQKYDNLPYDYIWDGKITGFNYGAGAFFRVYPINNFFLQGQFENNWITYTQKDYLYGASSKVTVNAPSFLAGIGYGQRQIGQMAYYTVLMIDLLNNVNSPYRDVYGGAIPILRGGFNFYLRPKKKK